MQKRKIFRTLLATAILATTLGCGEEEGTMWDDTAPTWLTEISGEIEAGQATGIIEKLDFDASEGWFFLPSPRPVAAANAYECTTESRGTDGVLYHNWIDANANGIPDDWYVKMSCVERDTSDTANVTTWTSRWEVTVKEDPSAPFGYTSSEHERIRQEDEQGLLIGQDVDATMSVDVRSGVATLSRAHRVRNWGKVEGRIEERTDGFEWEATFDPDTSITRGAPFPSGRLSYAGKRFSVHTGFAAISFAVETLEPLVYEPGCRAAETYPPFSAGVIRGRLNGRTDGAQFIATYTACGAFDVEVSNTSDEDGAMASRR